MKETQHVSGIILAAGKGSRFKHPTKNKTSIEFQGKPLVAYGVELYQQLTDDIIVVTGALEDSVKESLSDYDVSYVHQAERMGTGHATKVVVEHLSQRSHHTQPKFMFVGYGDHMMFYNPELATGLLEAVNNQNVAISLVAAQHERPNDLGWGRIVTDSSGAVLKIVEQKDATEDERKITDLNAGFYCFNFDFAKKSIGALTPSPVSGEYYLTDMVQIAIDNGLQVNALRVPFETGRSRDQHSRTPQTSKLP